MAKLSLLAGTTSKLLDVFIQDSSSTTGAGLTGLAYNTASLTGYYYREGAASAVAITLATMTLGTWASGGFIVVDGTNMPGCYQIGIPNAAIASGAKSVIIMLKGAANMAPLVIEIELTAIDNQDSVRAGLTALPNAAAAASGGLVINGSNTGTVTLGALTVTGATTMTGGLTAAITGSITGNLSGSVGSVTGAVGSVTGNVGGNVTGSVGSVVGAVGSVTGAVGSVTAGVTVTTNNDKTGYALTSGERTSVADALLNRDMSAVTVTNSRSPINALRALRNKVSVTAGTVYAEDDATAAWTFTTTVDAAQSPITVIDPA